jgi:hypothetical protein
MRFLCVWAFATGCFLSPTAFAFAEFAAGGSMAWSSRQQYGVRSEFYFSPEAVVFGYFPLFGKLHARAGVRGSYLWEQPDMPSSLRVEEKDFSGHFDAGVVWSGIVVPSVAVGVGRIWRSTRILTAEPIIFSDTRMNSTSQIDFWLVQLGLGLPVEPSFLLVEPFWRYQKASKDWRLSSVVGIEATFTFAAL